jgi:hypothetical protein
MGADWYEPYIIYGYIIGVPENKSYRKFIIKLNDLNTLVENPFSINGLLPTFHSRMEGRDNNDLDDYAVIVIGFTPSDNLEENVELGKKLAEYVKDTPILSGFVISEKPKFYTGIVWDYDGFVDSDEEDDDEDDDEDSEDGNEFDDNSYGTTDEEEDDSDDSDEEEKEADSDDEKEAVKGQEQD